MAGRTAEPMKTKLCIGTHIDLGSVLVKVKVNVIRIEARKGRENSSAKRDSLLRPEGGYLQLVLP